MTVVPAGSISLTEALLRSTLAGLSAFRTFVGVATEDEAAAHVYHSSLPPMTKGHESYTLAELRQYRPYAIIWTQETGNGFRWSNAAGYGASHVSGRLLARLIREVPDALANDQSAADVDFTNQIGAICDALIVAGQTPENLSVQAITLYSGPERNPEEEHHAVGSLQGVTLLIEWGVMGGEA